MISFFYIYKYKISRIERNGNIFFNFFLEEKWNLFLGHSKRWLEAPLNPLCPKSRKAPLNPFVPRKTNRGGPTWP
jgi:hypothetical protein